MSIEADHTGRCGYRSPTRPIRSSASPATMHRSPEQSQRSEIVDYWLCDELSARVDDALQVRARSNPARIVEERSRRCFAFHSRHMEFAPWPRLLYVVEFEPGQSSQWVTNRQPGCPSQPVGHKLGTWRSRNLHERCVPMRLRWLCAPGQVHQRSSHHDVATVLGLSHRPGIVGHHRDQNPRPASRRVGDLFNNKCVKDQRTAIDRRRLNLHAARGSHDANLEPAHSYAPISVAPARKPRGNLACHPPDVTTPATF